MLSVQEDPRGIPIETPEESPMGSLRSVGWDPLGVSGGIPEGSWRRSLRGVGPERKGKGYEVSCETSRWRPCKGCNRLFISLLQM